MAAGSAGQTATGEEAAMQAVAAAMRDAAATASQHAAKVKESTSEAGASALDSISRMVYIGSYVLAYGAVYATVFVAPVATPGEPGDARVSRRRAGRHGGARRHLALKAEPPRRQLGAAAG
jgi:hypothetical protein